MTEEYFRDNFVLVLYDSLADGYLINIKSTLNGEKAFPVDQRMLEQFSRGTLEDLSDDFATLGWGSEISRLDLERIHFATVHTMDKYNRKFEEFEKEQDL